MDKEVTQTKKAHDFICLMCGQTSDDKEDLCQPKENVDGF